jgi:signal transduction histidine kinase
MTPHNRPWVTATQLSWTKLLEQGKYRISSGRAGAISADYRAWRHQFLLSRLQLALWIALPCFSVLAAHSCYVVFSQNEQFTTNLISVYGDANIAVALRSSLVITCVLVFTTLVSSLLLLKTQWGQRHPIIIFLLVAWSLNSFFDQIIGSFFRDPSRPDILVFLAIALFIPVHWRLHLLAQAAPILYYAIAYPLLGLTQFGINPTLSIYQVRDIVNLFWVSFISILAVYLYEQLKQSEFETQRQLKVFLHSVSHDLQTPVMGATVLLKSLLRNSQEHLTLHRSVLERLLEGSDRQSILIQSLLDAHSSDIRSMQLACKPLELSVLVESVLANLNPLLAQHQVQLVNNIRADLPSVYADSDQLWRVFSNLITNALKHNPNGIQITLEAELINLNISRRDAKQLRSSSMLRCVVQDNGVGIPPSQCQRLFDLYTRGSRARYMPGLGLGLYLCRQIIQAHGGEIGVISRPNEGACFWFTLPLAGSSER